ncbi:calcium-activated chloride channel regulator 1-like isoform X1 [Dermacentor albipictus]|uniref:calcium-activated chloride channel regulator 1-like isoform X1 n=2 Tax=Dermacentor albipictus TaxID=60249 RepID=UPI0038FC5D96
MAKHSVGVFAFASLLANVAALLIDKSDGGYKDMLISIHDDVQPDEAIVENLKVVLRASSEFLHHATNGRVYFRHVIIDFPVTWPKRRGARGMSSKFFTLSDVRIENPAPTDDVPVFAKPSRRCGQRGKFIELSSSFLANLKPSATETFKSAAYAFVHAWAKFRYGVFEEYGSVYDDNYPFTYCTPDGKVTLNSCSSKILFSFEETCEIRENCQLTEDCQVVLFQGTGNPVDSSIMFMPYLHNISHFCEGKDGRHPHNRFAPNLHNKMCDGASTWEVISKNDDFKELPPPNMSKPIQVDFEEVQQKRKTIQRIVFALDVSRSMSSHNRLQIVKDAVVGFLLSLLDDSIRLAIVKFSRVAEVQHPMTAVNKATMGGFRDALHNLSTAGGTCIGCALEKAREVLRSLNETPEGAVIVLLTDGLENQHPYIEDVLPQLLEEKVEVLAMAVGDKAEDKLEKTAAATKGKTFFFPDSHENTSRAYIEATESPEQGHTRQRLGLITPNETGESATSVPVADGDETMSFYNEKFSPQEGALKAIPEISDRASKKQIDKLADVAEPHSLQSADSKCFQLSGYDSKIGIQIALGESVESGAVKPITVMSESENVVGTLEKTFIIDGDIGNNTVVTVSCASGQNCPLSVQLVDPAGQRCQNCPEDNTDLKKMLTIPSPAKAGTWMLQVKSSSTDRVKVSILVMSEVRDPTNMPVLASCELPKGPVHAPDQAIIDVSVSKGGKAVIGAKVIAVVVNTQGHWCLPQFDSGVDPDARVIDGTYSGYFTQFTGAGRYSVFAYIYGDSKTRHAYRRREPRGSSITVLNHPLPEGTVRVNLSYFVPGPTKYPPAHYFLDDVEPTPPFQRVIACGSFKVTSNLHEADVPPGRIIAFHSTIGHVEKDRTPVITLIWIWPGAHMTNGKAAAVEIRGGTDADGLFNDFENQELLTNVVKGSLEPLPAGSPHEVTISLPRHWGPAPRGDDSFHLTVYLAARAVNADGLKSERTMVIQAVYEIDNITAQLPSAVADALTPAKPSAMVSPATTTTRPARTEPPLDPVTTPTAEVHHEGQTSVFVWILLVAVAGVVVMAVIIALLLKIKSDYSDETSTNARERTRETMTR